MSFNENVPDFSSPNLNQSLESLFDPIELTSPSSYEKADVVVDQFVNMNFMLPAANDDSIDRILTDDMLDADFKELAETAASLKKDVSTNDDMLLNNELESFIPAQDFRLEVGNSNDLSNFELDSSFWASTADPQDFATEETQAQTQTIITSDEELHAAIEKLCESEANHQHSEVCDHDKQHSEDHVHTILNPVVPKFSSVKNIFKVHKTPIKTLKAINLPAIKGFTAKKPKQKRAKPEFTEKYFHRAAMYWERILDHGAYSENLFESEKIMARIGLTGISVDQYKKKVVAALLPNYVEVDSFDDLQGAEGWHYKTNPARDDEMLALRWCGQKQNFYTSYVYRHKVADNGKEIDKQFLCPYCPFSITMDMNTIFHTASTAAYQHHVCKDHGVYTTGYEMRIPIIGKVNGVPVAYCGECEQTHRIVLETDKDDLKNCLIAYFRHCFEQHNLKRQCRSNDTKHMDMLNQKAGREGYLHEDMDEIMATM